MNNINEFKKLFDQIAYGHNASIVFDDFMKICICAFSRNILTGLSNYEDEYLEIIKPYIKSGKIEKIPHLLAIMIDYMETEKDNSSGNDLLGSFYEQELSKGRNGQFFTPFHICKFMAQITEGEEQKSLNVLDPACGSGRMLLAHSKNSNSRHNYYGIDIDPMCVRMATINLFLNGLKGEVLCGNSLFPDDFSFSYRVSFFPLGIFKIENKVQSILWNLHKNSFSIRPEIPVIKKPEQLILF